MDDSDEESVPAKKAKMCCIHSPEGNDDGTLVNLRDFSSWNSLLKAAKIRQYEPLLNVAKSLKENQVPDLSYHRNCRSIFTIKKTLQAIEQHRETGAEVDIEETRRSLRQTPSHSIVYKEESFVKRTANI